MIAAEVGSRWLLMINAFLITLYLWSAMYIGPAGKRSVIEIIKGGIAPILWMGVIVCGIIIPIIISLSSYFVSELSPWVLIIAVGFEMVSAFSLKYIIKSWTKPFVRL